MKAFSSIIAIFLCILCIFYFLIYPYWRPVSLHSFSAKVLAKELDTEKHSNLSDALFLPDNKKYQKTLSAYCTFFCYINLSKETSIQITSLEIHKLQVTLLSETGSLFPCHHKYTHNSHTIICSDKSNSHPKRAFLKILNQSAFPCSIQLHSYKSAMKKRKTTNKLHHILKKHTTSNPATATPIPAKCATPNSATSVPKKKILSTILREKPVLYPQFLCIKESSVHKLSLHFHQKKLSLSGFTCISSNPSVARIKKEKVYAQKEGITILYLQNKTKPLQTSSCFVKVLKGENP